mmetsp:Transcript_54680/g.118213  ORF Transcript_54680/g.118213 Transcript_54680/m.118213 type:complete len:228 (+) Transcript_54680:231-914(+)
MCLPPGRHQHAPPETIGDFHAQGVFPAGHRQNRVRRTFDPVASRPTLLPPQPNSGHIKDPEWRNDFSGASCHAELGGRKCGGGRCSPGEAQLLGSQRGAGKPQGSLPGGRPAVQPYLQAAGSGAWLPPQAGARLDRPCALQKPPRCPNAIPVGRAVAGPPPTEEHRGPQSDLRCLLSRLHQHQCYRAHQDGEAPAQSPGRDRWQQAEDHDGAEEPGLPQMLRRERCA